MPSKKPRLALTVPEHRYELLKRLASLQGVSMASMVTDLLEECYPVLERVCVMLEAAKHASESAKEGMRESCDKAMAELEPYRDSVNSQFDLFMGQFVRQASEGADREGVPAAGGEASRTAPLESPPEAPNPRVVTRGSGITEHPSIPPVRKSRNPVSKRVSK